MSPYVYRVFRFDLVENWPVKSNKQRGIKSRIQTMKKKYLNRKFKFLRRERICDLKFLIVLQYLVDFCGMKM